MEFEVTSIAAQIGDLAQAGEKMIERLRRKAFLPESRKGLNVRFGIAEAADLLGCSTNRIRMAEEDGRLPPPPPMHQSHAIMDYCLSRGVNFWDTAGGPPYRAERRQLG